MRFLRLEWGKHVLARSLSAVTWTSAWRVHLRGTKLV